MKSCKMLWSSISKCKKTTIVELFSNSRSSKLILFNTIMMWKLTKLSSLFSCLRCGFLILWWLYTLSFPHNCMIHFCGISSSIAGFCPQVSPLLPWGIRLYCPQWTEEFQFRERLQKWMFCCRYFSFSYRRQKI